MSVDDLRIAMDQYLWKNSPPRKHLVEFPLIRQPISFDQISQNPFIKLQNLKLQPQTHNLRQLRILIPKSHISFLTPYNPKPQIRQQSIINLSLLESKLTSKIGKREADVSKRYLVWPIYICDISCEDEMSGFSLDLIWPQSKWNAIVFIILVCEAIPY